MSLFRTAARAGVAASVVGNVHRRQQQRWAAADAQSAAAPVAAPPPAVAAPAPTPPPQQASPTSGDMFAQLRQLAEFRDAGVLTEEEFAAQKSRILASTTP